MSEHANDGAASQLGRPRDPELDGRAIAAALEIYGTQGYSGFTFGKVAELARIGKSSLYLRWPTKSDLLGDAFSHIDAAFQEGEDAVKDGPFAARVLATVEQRLSVYLGPMGIASLRLLVDHVARPTELGELWQRSAGKALARAESLYQAGIDSGDVEPGVGAIQLARAMEGAAQVQALATPPDLREAAKETIPAEARSIVATTLVPWLTEKGRAGLPAD